MMEASARWIIGRGLVETDQHVLPLRVADDLRGADGERRIIRESLEQPLTIAGVPCYMLAAEAAGVIVELDAITAVGKLDRERADMTAAPLHGKCHVASRDSRKQRQVLETNGGDGALPALAGRE